MRPSTWTRDQSRARPEGGAVYSFNGWSFETDRRRLTSARGKEAFLTASEAQLLVNLLENANAVLSRDFLFESLDRTASSPFDRTIDVLISRLRRKIEENPRRPKILTTVRNTGYLLNAEVQKDVREPAA